MKEKQTVEYVKEQKEHKEGILSLLSVSFPNSNFSEEYDFLKYKNPISDYKPMGFVAVDNNIVVGYRGFVIIPFLIGEEAIKIAIPISGATHPDYRRMGIFSNLLKLSLINLKEQYAFTLNTSSNKFSLPSYIKLDWQVLGEKDYLIKKIFIKLLVRIPSGFDFSTDKNEMLDKVRFISRNTFFDINNKASIDLSDKNFIDWVFTRKDYKYLTIKKDGKALGYICFIISGKVCKIIHFDLIDSKSHLLYMTNFIAKNYNVSIFYFFTSKKKSIRGDVLKKIGFFSTNFLPLRKLAGKELTPFIIRPTCIDYNEIDLKINNVALSNIENWDITSLFNY